MHYFSAMLNGKTYFGFSFYSEEQQQQPSSIILPTPQKSIDYFPTSVRDGHKCSKYWILEIPMEQSIECKLKFSYIYFHSYISANFWWYSEVGRSWQYGTVELWQIIKKSEKYEEKPCSIVSNPFLSLNFGYQSLSLTSVSYLYFLSFSCIDVL